MVDFMIQDVDEVKRSPFRRLFDLDVIPIDPKHEFVRGQYIDRRTNQQLRVVYVHELRSGNEVWRMVTGRASICAVTNGDLRDGQTFFLRSDESYSSHTYSCKFESIELQLPHRVPDKPWILPGVVRAQSGDSRCWIRVIDDHQIQLTFVSMQGPPKLGDGCVVELAALGRGGFRINEVRRGC